MKKRILFTLLLALAPLAAHAQEQDPALRIEAARQRAGAAGIPVSLLQSKVAEGQAKGVPMDRIAAAVEQRLLLLSRAREAMGGMEVSPSDLAVGADALAAGVEPGALQGVARSAGGSRRAVAIAVLTQLVQQGEGSERAMERVRVALQRRPEELRNLPAMAGQKGPASARPERVGLPRAIPDPGRAGDTDRRKQKPTQAGGKRPPD